jgi:hypothetical protein
MKRTLFFALFVLAGTTGCEDHYSTQDAYAVCEDLTDRNPATNPPESFADCVACYESCGAECAQTGSAPEDYVCPDELDEGAQGGGSEG